MLVKAQAKNNMNFRWRGATILAMIVPIKFDQSSFDPEE
jgi:hypothetical protein